MMLILRVTMYHDLMSKKQVESILEELRPAIQADGGDVHLVNITTEGVVQVRFEGECLRCPSRDMTLRSGIETTLRNRLQNITGVEEVQN
jgi:Fe-S cluster biogenesis protein NfuA